MPYLQANGIRLFYEEYGPPDAPPVLLLPGMGEHHRSWQQVSTRLKDRRRVIALDNRDAGDSARASSQYSIADMAADTRAAMAALGLTSADVVGFSMGGAIAQELVLSHPKLVRSLILIATYDSGDARGTAIFHQFGHLRRTLSREDYFRTLLPWVYTSREYEAVVMSGDLVERLSRDPYHQEPEAHDRQVAAALAFRSRDRLGTIHCPTLLIFGDEDLFTPLRFARSLEAGIKGSRLALLAGTGHGLLWTRAPEVAALIDGFLP